MKMECDVKMKERNANNLEFTFDGGQVFSPAARSQHGIKWWVTGCQMVSKNPLAGLKINPGKTSFTEWQMTFYQWPNLCVLSSAYHNPKLASDWLKQFYLN